jgi:hypothetical protein
VRLRRQRGRGVTTTRAPWRQQSATARPLQRVPPPTTAARSASAPLIPFSTSETHGVHVPVAAQVGDKAFVVHPGR